MRTSLIIFFEPVLTLALIPSSYAPVKFLYDGRTYGHGYGLGTVFLDWLLTAEQELIGIQLDMDILALDGYGRSTLTKQEQEAQKSAAEANLSRNYITTTEGFVQLWFGSRRDFAPELSCHQYLVERNYATSGRKWAVGASFDRGYENIQELARIEAKWVGKEIQVVKEADP